MDQLVALVEAIRNICVVVFGISATIVGYQLGTRWLKSAVLGVTSNPSSGAFPTQAEMDWASEYVEDHQSSDWLELRRSVGSFEDARAIWLGHKEWGQL